jgi:hypothetical protein
VDARVRARIRVRRAREEQINAAGGQLRQPLRGITPGDALIKNLIE